MTRWPRLHKIFIFYFLEIRWIPVSHALKIGSRPLHDGVGFPSRKNIFVILSLKSINGKVVQWAMALWLHFFGVTTPHSVQFNFRLFLLLLSYLTSTSTKVESISTRIYKTNYVYIQISNAKSNLYAYIWVTFIHLERKFQPVLIYFVHFIQKLLSIWRGV